MATLVRCTGLSERTVRTCLDRPEAGGSIRPCAPDIVAGRIKCADRRPKGWDLELSLIGDDLTEADLAQGILVGAGDSAPVAGAFHAINAVLILGLSVGPHRMGWRGNLLTLLSQLRGTAPPPALSRACLSHAGTGALPPARLPPAGRRVSGRLSHGRAT